jgi:hypothetical protein
MVVVTGGPLHPQVSRSQQNKNQTGDFMMRRSLLILSVLGVSATAAVAGEVNINLYTLAPCKAAAQRYCDTSDKTPTRQNLLRCGSALASVSAEVGESCRQVLKRYGQI